VTVGNVTILVASIAGAILLIGGGLCAIAFGLAGLLLFGTASLLPIVLIGLIASAAGVMFARKITLPAWRLAKED
jgi:hypothetical protein